MKNIESKHNSYGQRLHAFMCELCWLLGCPQGRFGFNCSNTCKCAHGEPCNPVNGLCDCKDGFIGADCSTRKTCGQSCYSVKLSIVVRLKIFWIIIGQDVSYHFLYKMF